MKRTLTSFSIFIGILTISFCLFAGCNRDGDGGGDGKYYMTAKINGTNWESSSEQLAAGYQSFNNYLYLTGATGDENEIITINFTDFPGTTGTFSMGQGENEIICFYTVGITTYFVFDDEAAAIGTLNITTFDKKTLKGTFSFTGVTADGAATIEVTEGKFNLPMIYM